MFRANLRRNGVYETEGLRRLHGVKWKFKTERIIEAWFSSPTVSGDTVYFGSDDSYVYAVKALTGELNWKLKTGDVVYSSPAVAGGVVYVGSHDGSLYAIDAKTGSERWRFRTEGRVYSSPAVSEGFVYFGSADTFLYAVNAATGKLRWNRIFSGARRWYDLLRVLECLSIFCGYSDRTRKLEIQNRL